MKFSEKTYERLKWICLIFLPSAITLWGVIGATLDIPYTGAVTTIANAVAVFVGSLIGVSTMNYKKGEG